MGVTLVPVSAETQATTCANCGAELVADQRYCLECGQPSSPVRLAFLDVLEADARTTTTPALALEHRGGGSASIEGLSASSWLRRNAGWLLLLSVLLLCLIAGLLVGHWATQGKQTAGPTVVKVEGLGALPAGTGASSNTPAASEPASSGKADAKEEAQAAKEVAKETKAEKAPPPPPKKATTTLQKLSKTTGKKHAEEVNALGAQPIETG
jgi:hypothetical protein